MEWFIWVLVIWVALNVLGRGGCSWGRRYERRLRRTRARAFRFGSPPVQLQVRSQAPWGRRSAASSRHVASPKPRPEPAETPEERIRRRFVEGHIDLDQYEAELWEELKPRRS